MKTKISFAVSILFSVLGFFSSSATAAGEDGLKYSCYYSASSYHDEVGCPDRGYIFDTPEDAALSIQANWRAYYTANTSGFVSYATQDPNCSALTSPYYGVMCTYNANLAYDVNGERQQTGFKPQYQTIIREHEDECESSISLKGSIGTVIESSNGDGKKYVLSKSPGDPVCSSKCQYEKPSTDVCYYVKGSDNEGFCNYNYHLLVDSSGKSVSCQTDENLLLGEIGDPLNGVDPGTGGGSGGGSDDGGSTGGDDTGGGSTGDGSTGGDGGNGSVGGGDGSGGTGGTGGNDSSGDGSGTGGGSNDGSGGGSSGDTNENFESPGKLDLSPSVAGREVQVKNQFSTMKSEMESSQTFTSIRNASFGASHASAICPVFQTELFNTTIVFDSHCTLFDLIAPVLRLVFMAVWLFVAARIVLTA